MFMADDSARICELNGCTCILEDGQTCPEFDQEISDEAINSIAYGGEAEEVFGYAWEY